MIELKKIIIEGEIEQINAQTTEEDILSLFGEPEIYTPARKSYPLMLVYGDIEFRFRERKLTSFTLTLREDASGIPKEIDCSSLGSTYNRTFDGIFELLRNHKVEWKKDEIMSDSDQLVYITDKQVHLAFCNDILVRFGVVYR